MLEANARWMPSVWFTVATIAGGGCTATNRGHDSSGGGISLSGADESGDTGRGPQGVTSGITSDEGSETGDQGMATGEEPRFDVGMPADISGGGQTGCSKIDFLFVVDNSGSMSEEQQALANSFPGFIESIQTTVKAEDYHIMVIDSDSGGSSGGCPGSPGGASPQECAEWCAACPSSCNCECSGNPCPFTPGQTCDESLGAGKTRDQDGTSCDISGGSRYLLPDQTNLSDTFSCAALVGTSGSGDEKPMQAMMEAIGPLNETDGCNEGFVRDDAILVITFISDEEDDNGGGASGSAGDPTLWKQAVITAKNGDETAAVVLGLVGDNDQPNPICDSDEAEASLRLRTFATSFSYGSWASICSLDYAPFFEAAVSVIDTACDGFDPAG